MDIAKLFDGLVGFFGAVKHSCVGSNIMVCVVAEDGFYSDFIFCRFSGQAAQQNAQCKFMAIFGS